MARFRSVEQLITEAMKRGKFDNLSGKGKPLSPDSYSKVPELPRNVEELIKEAIERGEFDDLPGKGKPLDLDSYFKTPEHLRMAFHILKNAGYTPAPLELKKEIESLKKEQGATRDENKRRRLNREINEKTIAYDLAIEQNHPPSVAHKKGNR